MNIARAVLLMALAGAAVVQINGRAQAPPFDSQLVAAFTYRNLGPFRMGARIADIAVPESTAKERLYTMYVAPWTGGIFKTTNNGTTWQSIFDNVSRRLTVGALGIAPTNSSIIWAGTGDAFTSRSSYAGDGVYKSIDAGQTWQHVGLEETHHIARIVTHPADPDTVYVAAMGHLYSNNPERGVYKTTNGGRTWQKVFYVNERVGVIDLVIHRQNPNILYAATFDKQRKPHQIVAQGPESGIYKTTDGGTTWTRLGGGLPTGQIGRIGIDIHRRNPEVLYAIIANNNPRPGAPPPASPGARVTIVGGEVYRTSNGGETWTKMNPEDLNPSTKGPYYFNQIRVDPNNDMTIFLSGAPGGLSRDGGKTWEQIFRGFFGDNRTFWFDPENSDRMIMGSDGGIAISYDSGRTSDHLANLPVGEIYMVGADMDDPYNIYGGLQDHEHWRGPSTSGFSRGITQHEWFALGDGDGMYTQVDPTDSRWLYVTRHYGGHTRLDQKLGYEKTIVPQPPPGQPPYRWLWATPIVISRHDSKTLYTGAQNVLKSVDRGDTWVEISPDLSTNPKDKILPESEGCCPPGGIPWFTTSSLSESPITAGVIWAGLSDGKVWVTRDDGGNWSDMTAKLTALGARDDGYVSRVRASSHAVGRAYVAKSGYKFDDFRPFLYTTEDFGATWTSIASNLPQEPINVVFEDPRNPDLLYVGNDVGVFVSIDRGANWVRMNNNMPNVPVHDLVVHPREGDLVLGTYGRSFWVTNVRALQELTATVLSSDVHMFSVKPTTQRVTWQLGANDYVFGQRHIQTPNEPNAVVIRYYLKQAVTPDAKVVITNADGQEVARLAGSAKAGINTVLWDIGGGGRGGGRGTGSGATAAGVGAGGRGSTVGQGGGRGRGAAASVMDRLVPLGKYTVTLEVAGRTLTETASIVRTQGWSIGPSPQTIR
jgi:photosystem II stability/assembly factor-like uncharacterized protein